MITVFVLNGIVALCGPSSYNSHYIGCVSWMAECASQPIMHPQWMSQRKRDEFMLEACIEMLPESLWPDQQ